MPSVFSKIVVVFLKRYDKISHMKMNRIIKKTLFERDMTAGELCAKMGMTDAQFSQSITHTTVSAPKTLRRILDALQCHAEVVIVDDVTGERYKLD